MYGTNQVIDLLRSTYESVEDYGPEKLRGQLEAYFNIHNARVLEMFADLMNRTDQKDDVFGTVDTMEMTKAGEYGRPNAQKVQAGTIVGFPLESWQIATQWTYKFMKNATVSEVANQFVALRTADLERIVRETKRALFVPTNYTFNDYLVNKRTAYPLQVKRLVNADGQPLPVGPDGTVFPTNHTHYLASTTLTAAALQAAVDTVTEHYALGEPLIYINKANRTAVSGLAGFVKYDYAGVIAATTAARYESPRVDPLRTFNQAIGNFNGVEAWVKPWVPANYIFVYIRGGGVRRPLTMRVRNMAGFNLERVDQASEHPLYAETYEREFGVGANERTNGAVLMIGSDTYAAPSIAA